MENTTLAAAAALIGIAGTISGGILGVTGFCRIAKKDQKEEKKECQEEGQKEGIKEGLLKADTEYIRRRIDDVLLEQRETNKTLNVHAERLTRVEESAKQAHKRIDEHIGQERS
ncbi:MAG: hypothetical protein NC238_03070 [Dehalobacter sp.]|nr:hypothetical protein [Dehalobacter sp.]